MNVSWFLERDVDLLICEELLVNSQFARWFLSNFVANADPAVCIRAQPSVMTENGETDVEAVFAYPNEERIAVLIENKVDAAFQPEQLARYCRRAELGVSESKWHFCRVCLFAPARYLKSGPYLPEGVVPISFESAAEFLRSLGSEPRWLYRASFLERAAGGRPLTSIEEQLDPGRASYWTNVDELVSVHFSEFVVGGRRSFPKTTYINPRTADMPSYLRIDMKGQLGIVDLTFKNFSYAQLRDTVGQLAENFEVVMNGKSAALRLATAPFLIGDGFEGSEEKVLSAFSAASELMAFWRANRDHFDRQAAQLPVEDVTVER